MVLSSLKKRGAVVGAALLALASVGVASVTHAQIPAKTASASRAELNKPLPAFSVVDVTSGKAMGLTDVSAGKKATVLIFVSVQCPVSNAYNARMEEIAEKYGSKGVSVVGINSNGTETTAAAAAHAKEHKFTFPVTKDAGNKVADQFGAQVTPEVFVTDDKGVLVYHGPIDDNRDASAVTKHYLADALDAVVAGKAVPVASARAFGCTIKRQ